MQPFVISPSTLLNLWTCVIVLQNRPSTSSDRYWGALLGAAGGGLRGAIQSQAGLASGSGSLLDPQHAVSCQVGVAGGSGNRGPAVPVLGIHGRQAD